MTSSLNLSSFDAYQEVKMLEENDRSTMSFEIFSVMMSDDPNSDNEYISEKEEKDDEEGLDKLNNVEASFACEDCDYRWDVSVSENEDEEFEEDFYCPMCGSTSITQI